MPQIISGSLRWLIASFACSGPGGGKVLNRDAWHRCGWGMGLPVANYITPPARGTFQSAPAYMGLEL